MVRRREMLRMRSRRQSTVRVAPGGMGYLRLLGIMDDDFKACEDVLSETGHFFVFDMLSDFAVDKSRDRLCNVI